MFARRYLFNFLLSLTCCAATFAQSADETLVAETTLTALAFPGAPLFNDNPPFLAGVLVDHDDHTYLGGDLLHVTIQAEETAWMYLLYHQADGQTLLLYPNQVAGNQQVAKGTKVQIPPDDQSFRFRIQQPFGQEVLQVLASTKQIPELDDVLKSGGKAPRADRHTLTQLAERLSKEPDTWTEHRVPITTVGKKRPEEPVPPQVPARRFGLFVGIGEYQNPELASSHVELENSARIFHQHMTTSGGIDGGSAKLLINDQATRNAIEEAMTKWLPSVSLPGDLVFIFFSGHAGQYETVDRSETDGQDEALCPWDLNAGSSEMPFEQRIATAKATCILDDTLARWIQELSGRQVVLILDTCHSGGFVNEKSKPLTAKFMADEASRIKDISQMNVMVLSSCASDEQSQFEGTSNQTMWFTWCLGELFENPDVPRPLSVADGFRLVQARMRTLLLAANAAREQEPTMTDDVVLPVILIP